MQQMQLSPESGPRSCPKIRFRKMSILRTVSIQGSLVDPRLTFTVHLQPKPPTNAALGRAEFEKSTTPSTYCESESPKPPD